VTLTAKQTAFCQEYLVDFNATQAAIRAGYSERTANEQGARLLAKASAQLEIRRLVAARAQRVELDADFVVRMLVDNVKRSMQAVPVVDGDGNPIGEYRYNGAVANKALELLGRHLGMFTDKQEIEHSVRPGGNVLANLLVEVEARRRQMIIDTECIEIAMQETPTM
jgi:phage terminase small subunit